MKQFEQRNKHFDTLVNTKGLRWMGQNTNHYAIAPQVREAMINCIEGEEFHAYAPPLGLEELRALIIEELGLPGQSCMITDGAVEGLYNVCRTFCGPGDEFVTTDPTWAWPMAFAKAAGASVIQVPIYGPEHAYRLDPSRLANVVSDKTKIIYIVDPNNPIGTCCTEDEIRQIADIARGAGALLVHDCTYRDFAFNHTLAAQLYPERTVTVWSFSKWLGFAGLRVGSLTASPDIIETLASAPPNNLGSSMLAQRGAIAGLRTKAEWFPRVLQAQRANQKLIKEAVDRIDGLSIPIYPSNGNFLIVECGAANVRPEALAAVMGRHNIQIRHGGYHTKTFGGRFIKVSVTVPEPWVREFCDLLPKAVEEARGINEPIASF
jgi:aspartate/methionine/tyrosine aminotransferase